MVKQFQIGKNLTDVEMEQVRYRKENWLLKVK